MIKVIDEYSFEMCTSAYSMAYSMAYSITIPQTVDLTLCDLHL